MSRPLSKREAKHFGRSLAGHMRDKDRQRWKRKVTGQVMPAGSEKSLRAIRDEAVAEDAKGEDESEGLEDEIQ